MKRVPLLTVEHRFLIERPGVRMLIIRPDFPTPRSWKERGWSQRTEAVTVARPDGSEIEATAQINMTHLNIHGAEVPIEWIWRITLWLTDASEESVPIGSKILVSSEVREAILPSA